WPASNIWRRRGPPRIREEIRSARSSGEEDIATIVRRYIVRPATYAIESAEEAVKMCRHGQEPPAAASAARTAAPRLSDPLGVHREHQRRRARGSVRRRQRRPHRPQGPEG